MRRRQRTTQSPRFRLAALATGVTAAIAGLSAATPASAQAGPGHFAHSRSETAPFSRAGRWIVDRHGRVVIVHGFNIVQKTAPFYPAFLTAQDARFLASQGFTVARIGFIWSAAEPQPGVYDDAYIRHVIGVNDLLARYGIRTLIDFHQDAWNDGKGGDGAPAWATLGSDAVPYGQAHFQAFWDNAPAPDGIGIQTHFIDLWRHVVRMIDATRNTGNVIGFDPFNEPYPGTASGCAPFLEPCPSFESGQLADFYRSVIAAIRSTGDQHVIWPEGPPTQAPAALPTFADSQIGYNLHDYCLQALIAGLSRQPLSPADEAVCQQAEQHDLGAYFSAAGSRSEPAFLSEFGCSDDPEDTARVVDYADNALASWAIWTYQGQDCPGIRLDDSQPGSNANAKQAKLDALAVPYPQAIAGTPEGYNFDRATGTMTLTYSTEPVSGARLARGTKTQIYVPARHYPHGYTVSVRGARVVSHPDAAQVELVAIGSGEQVTVTITPASDHHATSRQQLTPTG